MQNKLPGDSKMDSKRKAFFDRIFGKNFWDNIRRYWFKYLDSGKRIISRDDAGKILHRL